MLSNDTMELYRSTIMSWVEDPGVDEFEGLDMRKLGLDQAYVVHSTSLDNVGLYAVSDDCYKCPLELQHTMTSDSSAPAAPWIVSTAHSASWRIMRNATEQFLSTKSRSGLVCDLRPELGEFGVYTLNVTASGCELVTKKDPVNIHLPLLLVTLILGGACVVYAAITLLVAYARRKSKMSYGDKELASQQRLRALDTFRGLTIILMIFVNYGGAQYEGWMSHATWNGLHVADLVFPCFVWIMGVCIPLSVKGVFSRGTPRWKALLHIVRRSCLMFLLGVAMNTIFGNNYLGTIRVMGVLQRLAVSYLVAASFYLLTTRKYFTHPRGACGQALKDVWAVVWCWLLAALLLALHTFLTLRVHDPDCPPGYLGPGGLHNNRAAEGKCAGGAAGYIDRLLLGDSHLYQKLSIVSVYGSGVFDPENILGCLTTIVHVIMGMQAGATLLHYKSHQARVARWLAWAVVLALVGAILAGFSRERGIIPINKNLWSISFVLVLSAFGNVLLSLCYLLTDTWRIWSGTPFNAPGRNAIFLYLAHNVCHYMFPFRWRVHGMRTHAVFLLENIWATALWVVVAHIMARKKIFVTL